MMITHQNVTHLLAGASLLACGGGLSYSEQIRLLQRPEIKVGLRRGVRLIDKSELPDSSYCVEVAEIGPADAPPAAKHQLPAALQLLKQKTHKDVMALIPAEIGQEAITLEAAILLNLPIVDTDLSGCRAVPRITDGVLVQKNIGFTASPLVMIKDESLLFIEQQESVIRDEKVVRSHTSTNRVVTTVGSLVSGAVIKRYLTYLSFSTALKLGEVVKEKSEWWQSLPTPVIFPCQLMRITQIEEKSGQGFDCMQVSLENQNYKLSIEVENEYLGCASSTQQFVFPDYIIISDPQTGLGLHSSQLKISQLVQVLVADRRRDI